MYLIEIKGSGHVKYKEGDNCTSQRSGDLVKVSNEQWNFPLHNVDKFVNLEI